jgi:putative ABC transport system permease protein
MLTEAADRTSIPGVGFGRLKLWVQDDQAEPLKVAITSDLQRQFPDMQTHVERMDYASGGDPFATVQLAVGGTAGLVLLLGAVGVLNISTVC